MSIAVKAEYISSDLSEEADDILDAARERGHLLNLSYAGDVTPPQAFKLVSRQAATLIDVRTVEERQSVGYVADAPHVAWATGQALERNPHFIRELESKAGKLDVILFLCRSGRRSVAAAEAASRLGFKNVFNVTEGFEGEQGQNNGWRARGLPWKKD
jgi:rhodanese-related sulfurtransferase